MTAILAHSPDIVLIPLAIFALPFIVLGIALPPQLMLPLRAPQAPAESRLMRGLSIALGAVFNLAGLASYLFFIHALCFAFCRPIEAEPVVMLLAILLLLALEALLFLRRLRKCRRAAAGLPCR